MTKVEQLLVEASKWVGIREKGGANRGYEVELFQKKIDGHTSGQAWCAAFVFYCLLETCGTDLFISSHVLTSWNKSPKQLRQRKPEPGCIMIWQRKGSSQGHMGIVAEVLDENRVCTIEGNTGPASIVSRDGDGVYRKFRAVRPVMGNLEVVGFLKPWFKEE